MKLVVTGIAALIGLAAFFLAHPYMNGVACTHQRECERKALLDVSYAIADQRHTEDIESEPKSVRQIVGDSPKPTDIDDSRFGVTMAWDIVPSVQYKMGDTDKTILLFPDAIPSTVTDPRTPLIAHVSSSSTTENDNCVLLVLATPEIQTLNLTNAELHQLIRCETPEDAASWFKQIRN